MPNVPTYAELGLKAINDPVWYGLVAPADTPENVINKLNAAVVKVLSQSEIKGRIAATGSEARSMSSEEFAAEIRNTFEKTKKIVETHRIKPEGS
jgi:tripartite-type tricarboxylate transporter receptor subunit TctC